MPNLVKKQKNNQMSRTAPLSMGIIGAAIVDELNKKYEPLASDEEKHEHNATFFDVIIRKMVRQAASGDATARREIFDRIDGKPGAQVTLPQVLAFLQQYQQKEELYELLPHLRPDTETDPDADIEVEPEEDDDAPPN